MGAREARGMRENWRRVVEELKLTKLGTWRGAEGGGGMWGSFVELAGCFRWRGKMPLAGGGWWVGFFPRHKLEATGDAEHKTGKEPADTRGTIANDLDLILPEDIWLWFVYSEPLSHILLSISPHHRATKVEYITL